MNILQHFVKHQFNKIAHFLFLFTVIHVPVILAQNIDLINDQLKGLQGKYAPDKRTNIFTYNITVTNDSTIVIRGEVENQDMKSDILRVLRNNALDHYIDSIEVLPQPIIGDRNYGIVIVSVANIRSNPAESAELATQVLMGNIVKIWKKKGGYYYIQAPDNYLGWIDGDQMARVDQEHAKQWTTEKRRFITAYFDFIYEQPYLSSYPISDITGGCIVKEESQERDWIKVSLADGRVGYIKKGNSIDYAEWGRSLVPKPENIERFGRFMLGVPYLWGGTSVKGIDCSGFTKTVFLLNGMLLNRDANQQAQQGIPVEPGDKFSNLKKGDLLFFGKKETEDTKERIVHVGIYLGDMQYIHSSGRVQINSFDKSSPIYDDYNLKRFVRARRVIIESPKLKEVPIQ